MQLLQMSFEDWDGSLTTEFNAQRVAAAYSGTGHDFADIQWELPRGLKVHHLRKILQGYVTISINDTIYTNTTFT